MEIINTAALSRIFLLTAISFMIAILWTPVLSGALYKFRFVKRLREQTWDGDRAEIFRQLHKAKAGTPTMGGLLVWVTAAVITALFNLSRAQTWLPLFVLVTSGALGLIDDYLNIRGKNLVRGLTTGIKFFFQFSIATLGAWWFFYKLEFSQIRIPANELFNLPQSVDIGLWYIPLFILTVVFISNAVNITDGLDGLAGGVLVASFGSIMGIAFIQGQIGIAAFAGTIIGALLAFLWFNIYPARFIMGDTGAFALGATLAVLAFLTNTVLVLPFIGLVFVVEALSSLLQRASKKFFNKKIFLIAPLHHHFESLGWPETKVTMRFWVIAFVSATIGMVLALI